MAIQIIYTDHVKNRLKERGISETEVHACLQNGCKQATFGSERGIFRYHYCRFYIVVQHTNKCLKLITAVVV